MASVRGGMSRLRRQERAQPRAAARPVDASVRFLDVPPRPEAERRVPAWPALPPPGYLGQLDPEFQRAQRAARAHIGPEDGHWYHETLLPDGRHIRGAWNLIDHEREYLGGVDCAGRRVLEFGPATGHLTVWLAMSGADVVAFDAGFDRCIDLLAYDAVDLAPQQAAAMRLIGQVQNSWWWLTGSWGLDVPAVYGEIYDLPDDIGMFDVSLFGAILLHLRDPYKALYEASRRTREQIIVTDVLPIDPRGSDADWSDFNPVNGDQSSWWRLSPTRVTRMLATMGFGKSEVFRHHQFIRPHHDIDVAFEPVEYFTVVAQRTAAPLDPAGAVIDLDSVAAPV